MEIYSLDRLIDTEEAERDEIAWTSKSLGHKYIYTAAAGEEKRREKKTCTGTSGRRYARS